MTEFRHVYILGSGFSIPLGGPTFNNLISQAEQSAVDEIVGSSAQSSHVLFRELPLKVKELWTVLGRNGEVNLEELLEAIDYASGVNQHEIASQIANSINCNPRDLEEIGRVIRIRLAISTTFFLDRIPDDSERWLPYLKWFRSLTTNDIIITFNYDRVVEKCAEMTGRSYFSTDMVDRTPMELINPSPGMPKLLKLHGSADWHVQGDPSVATLENIRAYKMDGLRYFIPNTNILIGTPGLSKPGLSKGLFKQMWEEAASEIRNANLVSLVGYSIPATDNLAKSLIEESIAGCKELKAVNLVLGPSAGTPVGKRAIEVLSQATRFTKPKNQCHFVKLWYRYSQDFLPSYRPKSFDELENFVNSVEVQHAVVGNSSRIYLL